MGEATFSRMSAVVARTLVGLSVEVSLPGSGSPGVFTVAELVTLGTAAADTSTVSVNTRLSPGASGPGLLAVTSPPAAANVHPVPRPDE